MNWTDGAAARTALVIPQVNLNGTSKNQLLEQYKKSIIALRNAHDALCNASPHGRDYQTMSPETYRIARMQHTNRTERLSTVTNELEAIYEGIYSQGASK